MRNPRALAFLAVGVSLRVLIGRLTWLVDTLSDRVELATPSTSWHNIEEGIFLIRHGINPYHGSVLHVQPLLLLLFAQVQHISHALGGALDLVGASFILCDVVTALALFSATTNHIRSRQLLENQLSASFDAQAHEKLGGRVGIDKCPRDTALLVMLLFILNPFSVLSCACKTLVTLELCLHALLVLACVRTSRAMAVVVLSISTYLFLFPVCLWVPVAWCVSSPARGGSVVRPLFVTMCLLAGSTLGLMWLSAELMQWDLSFVQSTWGFQWHITDLQPNVGLHWYFYMEMFGQYRGFFIAMIHVITLSCGVPLCHKFTRDRLLPVWSGVFLVCVYKSYPSVADAALAGALIPAVCPTLGLLRNVLFLGVLLLAAVPAMPAMYQVWVVTFNPNFFYAMTLVYGAALMLLWSDVLSAAARRTFLLHHGLCYPTAYHGQLKKLQLR